jgi:hypothetical protein
VSLSELGLLAQQLHELQSRGGEAEPLNDDEAEHREG